MTGTLFVLITWSGVKGPCWDICLIFCFEKLIASFELFKIEIVALPFKSDISFLICANFKVDMWHFAF